MNPRPVELKGCSICERPFQPDWAGETVCPGCKQVQHICCTSVADGVQALRGADLPTLKRCLEFEQHKNNRVTIVTALRRAIARAERMVKNEATGKEVIA